MNILGIAGKKGAGKDTCTRYLLCREAKKRTIIDDYKFDDSDGEFYFKQWDWNNWIHLDINCREESVLADLEPYIRNFQFAEPLKRKVGIEILGLDEKLVYGSQADKETLTHLKWENMPGIILPDDAFNFMFNYETSWGDNISDTVNELVPIYDDWTKIPFPFNGLKIPNMGMVHEPGTMSVREVLQYIGTDIFRKMMPNVWVDACIRDIKTHNTQLSVIHDVRFLNEAQAIKDAGGKVIKLLRATSKDGHSSEVEVDSIKADYELDNRNQAIEHTLCELAGVLQDWRYIDSNIS